MPLISYMKTAMRQVVPHIQELRPDQSSSVVLFLLLNGKKTDFCYSRVLLLFSSCDSIWSRPDQSSSVMSFGCRCLGLFSSARGWPRILFCFGIVLVSCRLRLSFPHGHSAATELRLLFLELIRRSGCRS
jgi:hypothetical protein